LSASEAATLSAPVAKSAQSLSAISISATLTEATPAERFRRWRAVCMAARLPVTIR
jgi:hypothetical protein